jgi:hypothetical protein
MKFFIKRQPDGTAKLMTESGRVIRTFSGMREAIERCAEEWNGANDEIPDTRGTGSKDRFDSAA